jgi:hypothetical protein
VFEGLRYFIPDYKLSRRDDAQAQTRGFHHRVGLAVILRRAAAHPACHRFMQDVDKEISEMKLSLNARARIVAESYLSTVRTFFSRRTDAADECVFPSLLDKRAWQDSIVGVCVAWVVDILREYDKTLG